MSARAHLCAHLCVCVYMCVCAGVRRRVAGALSASVFLGYVWGRGCPGWVGLPAASSPRRPWCWSCHRARSAPRPCTCPLCTPLRAPPCTGSMLVGGLIAGTVSDRIGRKPCLLGSLVINGLFALLSAASNGAHQCVQLSWRWGAYSAAGSILRCCRPARVAAVH
jgi:hypothetical protein